MHNQSLENICAKVGKVSMLCSKRVTQLALTFRRKLGGFIVGMSESGGRVLED